MKRFLLVLTLLLLSSLLFAQAGPDPQAQTTGYVNGQASMYWYWYAWRMHGEGQMPLQYRLMAAQGVPEKEPMALQNGDPGESAGIQVQDRDRDRDGDCDGEPDQVRENKRLQDGSCDDGGDGPPDQDQGQSRSGKGSQR